jgi:hypothetical protein
MFEGRLAYDESHTGPANIDVYVDGMLFLDPYLPIHWAAVRPRNFIEIPDAEPELQSLFPFDHTEGRPFRVLSCGRQDLRGCRYR